jgi:hypothetical protein
MLGRVVTIALAAWLIAAVSYAQQPVPLYPGAAPRSIEPEPLPPLPPGAPSPAPAPPPNEANLGPATARVFCEQQVTLRLADPDSVPARYRPFLGIWSDAAWSPQLCAALIVQSVASDGTAAIVYTFGPMGSNLRGGGVLHGTGIIRDGELRFQNSDGSQFAFKPLYADLDGKLTTPQGQTYEAVFKRTP